MTTLSRFLIGGVLGIAALCSSHGVLVDFADSDYDLGLDFFRTAGPNEEIFLAGDGTILDPAITFGTTTLHVLDLDAIVPDLSIARSGVGDAAMDLSFTTFKGLTYTAQTSIDLVVWDDLVTIEGDGAQFSFCHAGGGGAERNFYRVTVTTDGT